MKKNIKKFIPAIMVTTMLATSSVFAENSVAVDTTPSVEAEVPATPVETEEIISITPSQEVKNIVVKLIKNEDSLLFPVRQFFEELGFEVSYEPNTKTVTLVNAPQFVTFSTNKDAYTFARMAPQQLGQAPIVKEGVTYVPVTLLTDIMQMEGVTIDEAGLTLTLASKTEVIEATEIVEAKPVINQNIITEVNEKENTITIKDFEKGEVVLNIKDVNVEYTTEIKTLQVGQAVEIEYGDVMTASLPPMNVPKSVKVVPKYNVVEVVSVDKIENEENFKVLVKDAEIGEVALIVSKDTKLDGIEDISKLEKNQILKVAFSDAMTMSLPPQTVAKEISIITMEVSESTENTETKVPSKVEIISFDKENGTINIKDEKIGEVVLNISENTQIEFENADESNKTIWEYITNGKSLEVVFDDAMTRSIPPINNPIKITVLK